MRPTIALVLLVAVSLFSASASAHGDLTINELETLAIRDFEGQEDSFAWEGFEIWDVYVGDGYSHAYDSDGVYFKVNFAGDGTQRPTGSAAWGIAFSFKVAGELFERELTHDGTDITTTFEALEWTIADGNVLQVKAWAPVPAWQGKAVTDIVIVSSVDGDPRDTAPGGIHVPVTGTEIPVQAQATPIFPAMGEGRIVDEVKLTGPGKYLNVTVVPKGDGVFEFKVQNPLKEQGQHVFFRQPAANASWKAETSIPGANLEGGASREFKVTLTPPASGVVEPFPLEFYTDIGGRQTYYAYLDAGEVAVVSDPATAQTATVSDAAKGTPGFGILPLLAALAIGILAMRRHGR